MDLEQLAKRLDWLDDERRKDKTDYSNPGRAAGRPKGSLTRSIQQVKKLSGELTRFQRCCQSLTRSMRHWLRCGLTCPFDRSGGKTAWSASGKWKRRHGRPGDAQPKHCRSAPGTGSDPGTAQILQARMEEDFRLARLIEEVNRKYLNTAAPMKNTAGRRSCWKRRSARRPSA